MNQFKASQNLRRQATEEYACASEAINELQKKLDEAYKNYFDWDTGHNRGELFTFIKATEAELQCLVDARKELIGNWESWSEEDLAFS